MLATLVLKVFKKEKEIKNIKKKILIVLQNFKELNLILVNL